MRYWLQATLTAPLFIEAEEGDRIPSLAFWIDWADTLGISLEKVTAARAIIRRALDEELVCSSSEKGPLRIAFPPQGARRLVSSAFH